MGNRYKDGRTIIRLSSINSSASSYKLDWEKLNKYINKFDKNQILSLIDSLFPGIPEPIFKEHHDCHAASAYYFSGFSDSLIFVIDASGEEYCTSIYRGNNANMEKIKEFQIPHSLGHFYQAVTEYLGYVPHQDEGTVMALAGIGDIDQRIQAFFSNCIILKDGNYFINTDYISKSVFFNKRDQYNGKTYTDEFAQELYKLGIHPTVKNNDSKSTFERRADCAATAQMKLEEVVVGLSEYYLENCNTKNICLAGGVALNCKLNWKILETLIPKFQLKGLFAQPASHDAGAALGAAMLSWVQDYQNNPLPIRQTSVSLGPKFHKNEIENQLNIHDLKYLPLNNNWKFLLKMLHSGKTIALFSGRMEFGPRALGNRSIIASPRSREILAKLNQLKEREWFRPFSPSMLNCDELEIPFRNNYEPLFMQMAYEKPDKVLTNLVGAFHTDGSWRPQLVDENSNLCLAKILNKYKKISGHPVLLNTSFNINEPIVCTPEQAIKTFLRSKIDLMIIEDNIVFQY